MLRQVKPFSPDLFQECVETRIPGKHLSHNTEVFQSCISIREGSAYVVAEMQIDRVVEQNDQVLCLLVFISAERHLKLQILQGVSRPGIYNIEGGLPKGLATLVGFRFYIPQQCIREVALLPPYPSKTVLILRVRNEGKPRKQILYMRLGKERNRTGKVSMGSPVLAEPLR